MAISNYTLPFNLQNSTKFDIRNRPDKYAQSDLRSWRFEQSEGIRPAEYYAPYRFMPVGFKDVNTEDYVVIPKGRIVAAISTEDGSSYSGIMYPSGVLTNQSIGFAATEMGGAVIRVSQDQFFGYSDFTSNLLVLANGGETLSGFYTADDVTAGTIGANGSLVSASGAYSTVANAPIGVAFHDWYQDIRGRNLNYQMHPEGGHVLTDWYVEVPYIKATNAGTASGCSPRYTNATYSSLTTYWTINKQFTYLSIANSEAASFRDGFYVQSDLLGNYKPQAAPIVSNAVTTASGGATSVVSTIDTAVTRIKTVQTVGKILSIDNRFPKGSLEDVLTYPGSGMPGSQTAGMSKVLFDFAYYCLQLGPRGGAGTAPTIEEVYNAIRSGFFGLARIQLLVS